MSVCQRLLPTSLILFAHSTGAAWSVTTQAIYTGTIAARGYDSTNLFGAGTDLTGQVFRLVVTFDTAMPGANRHRTAQSDDLAGGSDLRAPSPVKSARITINNHTEAFGVGTLGILSNTAYDDESSNGQFALDQWTRGKMTGTTSVQAYAHASDPRTLPSILGKPVPLTRLGGEQVWGDGLFSIYACEVTGDGCETRVDAGGMFVPETVRIAAIPLPGSLSLMLLGLGLIAGLGCQSRRTSGSSMPGTSIAASNTAPANGCSARAAASIPSQAVVI